MKEEAEIDYISSKYDLDTDKWALVTIYKMKVEMLSQDEYEKQVEEYGEKGVQLRNEFEIRLEG